jgi:hypothetical protein
MTCGASLFNVSSSRLSTLCVVHGAPPPGLRSKSFHTTLANGR